MVIDGDLLQSCLVRRPPHLQILYLTLLKCIPTITVCGIHIYCLRISVFHSLSRKDRWTQEPNFSQYTHPMGSGRPPVAAGECNISLKPIDHIPSIVCIRPLIRHTDKHTRLVIMDRRYCYHACTNQFGPVSWSGKYK